MKRSLLFFAVLAAVSTVSGQPEATLSGRAEDRLPDACTAVRVVPQPAEAVPGEGWFGMRASTPVVATQDDAALLRRAEIFAESLRPCFSRRIAVRREAPRDGAVNLRVDPALGREEYRLEVTPRRIDIAGGSAEGVFYGLQTLRQLIPVAGGRCRAVPAVRIADRPVFAYRGMHLDVARHFFPVDEVKRYLDILALHKINRFHWHLTDDQGWRIEILRYPALTRIGSVRPETVVGHPRERKGYDGTPHGGFYTQDEVRDVVRYAAERGITVIPEIEMPGHASAALAACPWAGCTGGPYAVEKRWGIFEEVFCAGKEETFRLLEGVLEEVLSLFPSEYIHLGGDECPRKRWKACPDCQARMKAEGLKDEHELQSYFMRRMERWLRERGRKMIGWDEILEGGVSPTATVMSWRGTRGGVAAARMGNPVVMAPTTHCYLDYYQGDDPAAEPLSIGWGLPVEKTYALDPFEGLDERERRFILGVQANLWTEYISDFAHVEYMLLPRLAALAETAWACDRKDFGSFRERMRSMARLYDRCGYRYARHLFAPADGAAR